MSEPAEVIEGTVSAAPLSVRQGTALDSVDLKALRNYTANRAEALRTMMEVAIAQTTAEDWRNLGGKPYPEQGACSSLIATIGISITPPDKEREDFDDELGHYYVYFLESEVSVPKFGIGPLPVVGRCSSRDQFFAMRSGTLRPASEIDPGDIKAAAYTNLRYRAVKAVVPQIAGMTWEELQALTGGRVRADNVARVDYTDGAQAGAAIPCPKCGKGTVVEKANRETKEPFWVCSEGKYDAKTKTRSGCDFFTKVKPSAPAPAGNGNGQENPAQKTSAEMMKSVRQAWKDTEPALTTEAQRKASWEAFLTKRGLDPKTVTLGSAGDDLMGEYVMSLAPGAEEPEPEPEPGEDGTPGMQQTWADPDPAQQ
jgi:ssDNA-binding Zn-finger/Zn-ribbon topoisomerase 1